MCHLAHVQLLQNSGHVVRLRHDVGTRHGAGTGHDPDLWVWLHLATQLSVLVKQSPALTGLLARKKPTLGAETLPCAAQQQFNCVARSGICGSCAQPLLAGLQFSVKGAVTLGTQHSTAKYPQITVAAPWPLTPTPHHHAELHPQSVGSTLGLDT